MCYWVLLLNGYVNSRIGYSNLYISNQFGANKAVVLRLLQTIGKVRERHRSERPWKTSAREVIALFCRTLANPPSTGKRLKELWHLLNRALVGQAEWR